MGKAHQKDTISIYLSREEHVQLAIMKTQLGLTQTETMLLGLQILASLQHKPWEIEPYLDEKGRPIRAVPAPSP